MKKIVIATDSFKGTLSSEEICDIIEDEICKIMPECETVPLAIADGGEGTVDAFIFCTHGTKYTCSVTGPHFENVEAYYGIIDSDTAIVEMAAAAGLPLAGDKKNPSTTTTLGVGELILKALDHNPRKIIIGLGGSATNDAGCGLAAGLGIRFYDAEGISFVPTGSTLHDIRRIDRSGLDSRLEGVELLAMCDVTNPLYGENGAAHIFGPQKGADEDMVRFLDGQLRTFSERLIDQNLPDISTLPGGGAAGGLGAGLSAFLNVPLVSGIDLVLDTLNFEHLIEGADLIITGEGRIDGQSIQGKVLTGICSKSKPRNIPVCVISGQALDDQLENIYDFGVSGVFTINREAAPFSVSAPLSAKNLRHTARALLNFTKSISKN